jgi:hypothetical protein
MDIKHFDKFSNSKLVDDISLEFNISKETAIRRILLALSNPDFTDSIEEPIKNYLNKIEHLISADGSIEIVNMDKY